MRLCWIWYIKRKFWRFRMAGEVSVFCILCIHSLYCCIRLWCFLKQGYFSDWEHGFETSGMLLFHYFFCPIIVYRIANAIQTVNGMQFSVWKFAFIDGLHLFWFRKLVHADAFKSGRQKTRWTSFVSNQTQLQWWTKKFGGESEYYLALEHEDKKWYTKKSTYSKG